jgi:hypothetical protein
MAIKWFLKSFINLHIWVNHDIWSIPPHDIKKKYIFRKPVFTQYVTKFILACHVVKASYTHSADPICLLYPTSVTQKTKLLDYWHWFCLCLCIMWMWAVLPTFQVYMLPPSSGVKWVVWVTWSKDQRAESKINNESMWMPNISNSGYHTVLTGLKWSLNTSDDGVTINTLN